MARLLFALVLISMLASPAFCMPEYMKKYVHKYEEYKLLVIKGNAADEVAKLVAAPDKYKIVVWQALPEQTRPEDVAKVMAWVDNGGVAWFHDSRLAPLFGMEAAEIQEKDLRFKPHRGEYGATRVDGAATLSAVAGVNTSHPLARGVDYVQVFLVRVSPGMYSCVRETPGMTAILKIQPISNQPHFEKVIVGILPRGKGHVVFKPLIFSEQVTGERMQINLLEWSAGFGVPDMMGNTIGSAIPPETPAAASSVPLDRLVMKDKRVLEGTIQDKSFRIFMTVPNLITGTIELRLASSIVIQEDGAQDAVMLFDGKKLMGTVMFSEDINLKGTNGTVTKIMKSEVARISIVPGPNSHKPIKIKMEGGVEAPSMK
ncbi:MAG: hypothetical protein FJX76_06070 [Armatimonadetes bacterium]|nr:hypothetical protein [Armatimonadota bacterium]